MVLPKTNPQTPVAYLQAITAHWLEIAALQDSPVGKTKHRNQCWHKVSGGPATSPPPDSTLVIASGTKGGLSHGTDLSLIQYLTRRILPQLKLLMRVFVRAAHNMNPHLYHGLLLTFLETIFVAWWRPQ